MKSRHFSRTETDDVEAEGLAMTADGSAGCVPGLIPPYDGSLSREEIMFISMGVDPLSCTRIVIFCLRMKILLRSSSLLKDYHNPLYL